MTKTSCAADHVVSFHFGILQVTKIGGVEGLGARLTFKQN